MAVEQKHIELILEDGSSLLIERGDPSLPLPEEYVLPVPKNKKPPWKHTFHFYRLDRKKGVYFKVEE
jgi:hypothetical protein